MRWWYRWRHRNSPYVAAYATPPDARVFSIDLETTGLDPATCRVLSLAAVPMEGMRILTSEALYLKVRDEGDITLDSMRHHRLRSIDLQSGVSLEEALKQFVERVGSRPLLGYCVAFDYAVLQRLCREHLGISLCNRRLELRERFEQRWRQRHPELEPHLDLDSILQSLGLPTLERHDAYADAVATAAAWLKLG